MLAILLLLIRETDAEMQYSNAFMVAHLTKVRSIIIIIFININIIIDFLINSFVVTLRNAVVTSTTSVFNLFTLCNRNELNG